MIAKRHNATLVCFFLVNCNVIPVKSVDVKRRPALKTKFEHQRFSAYAVKQTVQSRDKKVDLNSKNTNFNFNTNAYS